MALNKTHKIVTLVQFLFYCMCKRREQCREVRNQGNGELYSMAYAYGYKYQKEKSGKV